VKRKQRALKPCSTGNARRLGWYRYQLERIWKKWLGTRGGQGKLTWASFRAMLDTHPLPPVKIVHQYAAT